jgi:hypothetical protein
VTEGQLVSGVGWHGARSVLVWRVILVVGACVLAAGCGSTPDARPGSAAEAEAPTTLFLESSALEPGGASTWSGEAAGVPWEISTRLDERTGVRCVRLSFAESHESCEIQPVLHSEDDEPVMALHFQRGRDIQRSVIAGLVPVGTDAIGLAGAREHFDLYVDPPTGVFVIIGPAGGHADMFTLSVGAEQVECSIHAGDVSDLAYLC